jgi:hypothetical protein
MSKRFIRYAVTLRHTLFSLRFYSTMILYILSLHYLLVRFEYLVGTCIIPLL